MLKFLITIKIIKQKELIGEGFQNFINSNAPTFINQI